jgi:epoxyqueuosine reductase
MGNTIYMTAKPLLTSAQLSQLAADIKTWGQQLGFQQVAITDTDLGEYKQHLANWLARGFHGEMHYMTQNQEKRTDPQQLVTGTQRIIVVRMDYLPQDPKVIKLLKNPHKAYIARYALGRDYHRLIRQRLKQLGKRLQDQVENNIGWRPFVDSAPVLEKALATKAGLGWLGKNTLVLNDKAGSWFFLGALFTNLPLSIDQPVPAKCGNCSACLTICPTQAIVAPYQLDARRCISYLTIEAKGPIPLALRPAVGNRIFGCDDCQLICPWNRFAKASQEEDFKPRHGLDDADLLALFNWSEAAFDQRTQGSAIRRTGYQGWLRNLAVALGNAPANRAIIKALTAKKAQLSHWPMVLEHIDWAIQQQQGKLAQATQPSVAHHTKQARQTCLIKLASHFYSS